MEYPPQQRQSYDALPGRVLTRIFEHLFWVAMRDNDMRAYYLPLGHRALLPSLSVSHAWRMRAAKLFYRVAVIVVGSGDMTAWAMPTRRPSSNRANSHHAKTNIDLILESGYAPKTLQLLVYSTTDRLAPTEMAAEVVGASSRFCEFVWPSITRLYFYHPAVPPLVTLVGSDAELANDRAIAAINNSLALSMPRLSHVSALSNTRDSFGLFALDDLIIAKLSQLRALTVLSRVPIRLGAEEFPHFLTRLTIRGSSSSRNSSSSYIVSIPRTTAASLISLDIGPILPFDFWTPFTSGISDFTCLRELRLAFCNMRALLSADGYGHHHHHHQQHRHLLRYRHRSRLRRHSSSDSGGAGSGWPLFPRLAILEVEGYPYDTAYFLENFPRSQLTRLAIRRCSHQISGFSLTPFTGLISFNGDVPDCNPATAAAANIGSTASIASSNSNSSDGSNESSIEEWVGQTMQADMPTLRSLSLNVGPDIFVELPAHFGLHGLRHLSLNTGLRISEVEKILLNLERLRSLRVTITEVLSKAHEYLSRTTRHHKYLPAEMHERPWLSTTLEDLAVWLLEPSPGRQHRALLKIVYMAMRVPSILRISTQREHVDELRALSRHLPTLQVREACPSFVD